MEHFRESILSVCMLSASIGILSLIYPSALDRQIKFLMSMLFLVSMITPFVGMEFPTESAIVTAEQIEQGKIRLSDKLQETVLKESEKRICEAVKEKLNSAGIRCDRVEVELHMNDENCIYCSEVKAECDNFADACRILNALFGEEVEICVTQTIP